MSPNHMAHSYALRELPWVSKTKTPLSSNFSVTWRVLGNWCEANFLPQDIGWWLSGGRSGAEKRLIASQPLLQEPNFDVHLLDFNPLWHALVFRCHDVGIFAIGREWFLSGNFSAFICFWKSSYILQLTSANLGILYPQFSWLDHPRAGHLQRIYQMIRPMQKYPVWRKHYMTGAIMNASVLLLRQAYLPRSTAFLCRHYDF